jgi:DNA polymerase-3 subunit gamma/tau
MPSQALYRRYRSQTFGELVGQEHIVQTLRNALAEGRLAHAYLFTGPRGVGKTTMARLLAKALNCTADAAARPCGACASCVAIAEGSAVDVIEMDAASHTSVEDAREIIERVQFRPSIGIYKIYIIDEVHMLSTAAFNALLKTLEEPPGHAVFVLATTEVHKVPATILSRCQRFTFSRHTVAAMAMHLRQIAAQEQFTLEPGVPEMIARAATGSMRDALSVLDQLMAYGGSLISVEQVRGLLGASEAQEVTALVDALLAADLASALRVIAAVAARGADLRQFTRDLVEKLRALLLLKAAADPSLLDASDDELETLNAQAAGAPIGALLAWTRLFGELDFQLRTSPYGQLPLELAAVEAIAARPAAEQAPVAAPRPAQPGRSTSNPPPRRAPQPEQQALAPVRSAPSQLPTSQAPEAAPTEPDPLLAQQARESQPELPAAPVAQETPRAEPPSAPAEPRAPAPAPAEDVLEANADVAALEYVESIWPDVVRDVRVHDKTLQALLNSGVRPVDVRESTVILEVANEWLIGRLEKPNLRQTVEKVISKHMGANYFISCVVEAQNRTNRNELREQIRNSRKDPLVKAAINIFDADIVRVEHDEEIEP